MTEPTDAELYAIYLRHGLDELVPFRGLPAYGGDREGIEIAREIWERENANPDA